MIETKASLVPRAHTIALVTKYQGVVSNGQRVGLDVGMMLRLHGCGSEGCVAEILSGPHAGEFCDIPADFELAI